MSKLLLSNFLEESASTPNGITFVLGENKEKHLSYHDLHHRALILLGHFQSKGVSAGQEMIILVNKNEQFIDAFWACILGGIVPVPLSTGISDNHSEKIAKVFQKLKAPLVYSSNQVLSRFTDFLSLHNRSLVEVVRNKSLLVEEVTDTEGKGSPHQANPQDLAFIQFSSGSTGEPKGVMLSHENLISNIEAITHGSNFSKDDRTLGWMPLTHDMGLIGFHMVPLASGANQLLMSTELFVRRPMLWIQKSSKHAITITCSPNFGYKHFLKYLNPSDLKGVDISSVRLILNGAEPISAALCRSFMEQLAHYGLNKNSMFPVYGLAEASLAVSFPVPGTPLETVMVDRNHLSINDRVQTGPGNNTLELVKLGTQVEHCNLKITDAQGHQLPELTVGKLQISGKNVTRGYYQDSEATDELIKDGWLDTGDLAFMDHGSLVLTGRSKDVIFLNGQNLYPHDIEHVLEQLDELEIGKTAVTGVIDDQSMTEEPAVFVAYKGSLDAFGPLTKTIKGHLSAHTGLEVNKVIPVQTIPKTTSGKVQRFLLAKQYHLGEFKEIEHKLSSLMAKLTNGQDEQASSIEVTLLGICKEFLSDEIKTTDNLFELGTSSLTLTQIHDRIDSIWPNKVELTDYFDYPTISELAEYLKREST